MTAGTKPKKSQLDILRGVTKHQYGNTLDYRLRGACGEWVVYPTGYFERKHKRPAERTWMVRENYRIPWPYPKDADALAATQADKARIASQPAVGPFATEAEAAMWVTVEHERRYDEQEVAVLTAAAEELGEAARAAEAHYRILQADYDEVVARLEALADAPGGRL